MRSTAIFTETGELVSVGVNLVVPGNNSTNHAEMVAIQLAQQRTQHFTLSGKHRLYTSAQPCVMCWGACFWAGLGHLAYAASSDDVEEHTIFREGPVPGNWSALLREQCGITVDHGLLSQKAIPVLIAYSGPDYNGATAGV